MEDRIESTAPSGIAGLQKQTCEREEIVAVERLGETQLLDAREQLRHLLAASPAIIYQTNVSGDFACTFVSDNVQTILGYTPEEMLTDPKHWPDRLHPEDAPQVFRELPDLITMGGGTVEYRFRISDGTYLWIQDTFKVINDEKGRPAELVGAWADITKIKLAEKNALEANVELQETKRSLSRLIESAPDAIIATDKDGKITLFNGGAAALLGYEAEEIMGRHVSMLSGNEAGANEILEAMHERGGSVSGFDSMLYSKGGTGIPVLISASVIYDDNREPIGTVGFATDVRDRKRAEEELQGARQRFEHVLAVSPTIIYTTQMSGDFACTFVSDNVEIILGYTPEEMLTDPKHWPDRLHPEDARRVLDELPPLIEVGAGTIEYRFRLSDGKYLWIQDTFQVVHDDEGRPLELVGAWANISKRKHAEQKALKANAELQETKRSLIRLIESSPDAIISTDKDGSITLFNEGAETLLGFRADEVVGRNVSILYGGAAGANEVLREMQKRGGTVSGLETMLWGKDGAGIPVQVSASLLFDDRGEQIGTVGFATDQRERKRAQEELQKAYDDLEERVEERTIELQTARERLQYLLTVTPGIMYTNEATGNFRCTFVSQNVGPVMGFSEWEMLEDHDFWRNRLDPDDAGSVFQKMTPLIEKGGGTLEYRFRHRDGHYVWIQDTFRVVRDESGRPFEIVGSWADITDRKRVEKALGERMALMNDLQNLVAASPAVIYTTKAAGDFACTFVSENLLSTMGYAPWEMREDPKFWSKRLHPDDADRVFSQMAGLIEAGAGTIEYRFRHRGGHYIWIQDTFTVTREKDGSPKELVGSWADISDRKKIESQVHELVKDVQLRNQFIRQTFGRYLTDEVVATLLDSPSGLQMGGEKRKVTMMMADLRGFTSLSERLDPKWVVTILNRYLAAMVEIIKKYGGTIDEFIGDAIFVLFGAPLWKEDDAHRAVACAIEMQQAMHVVNEKNRQDQLPDVEIGIGLHTGQVVVGNIGSSERMKYGVVGSHVNLTSRIQSFTTGGQILISETTRREVGRMLRPGRQMEVRAKGFEHPIALSEVLGIGGPYKLSLIRMLEQMIQPPQEILMKCSRMEGESLDAEVFSGWMVKLSPKRAEARLERRVDALSNLKIRITDGDGRQLAGSLYCKVESAASAGSSLYALRFTSMSPEIKAFLHKFLEVRDPRMSSQDGESVAETGEQKAPPACAE